MNEKFASSVLLPEEWDIYGWKLRKFSLRFHMLLSVIDSPYIRGQVPTAYDTFLLLKVCSNTEDDVFKIPKATLGERFFYARLLYSERFHAKVFIRIIDYLKENTVNPNTTIRSRIKIPNETEEHVIKPTNGLPDELFVIALFARKFNFSPEFTWNIPISMVGWYVAALAAVEGAEVSIGEPEDEVENISESLAKWEQEQAEKLRLAMVNGKIPKKKIKLSSE